MFTILNRVESINLIWSYVFKFDLNLFCMFRIFNFSITDFRRMLELLEEEEDVHWSVHSPNIYDALSIMYNPQDSETLDGLHDTALSSASTFPIDTAIGSAAARNGLPEPPPPNNFEEYSVEEKSLLGNCRGMFAGVLLYFWALLSTLSRQSYHILKMRVAEVYSNLTQFIYTQILLPFFVVLGVVVGCRDVSYPKVELSSRNSDGIGEICVGVGPGSAKTRQRTPLSSPYDKVTANQNVSGTTLLNQLSRADFNDEKNTSDSNTSSTFSEIHQRDLENNDSVYNLAPNSSHTLKIVKMFVRIWRRIESFFYPKTREKPADGPQDNVEPQYSESLLNDSSLHHSKYFEYGTNQTLNDYHATQEYSGYPRLLALLGKY